jgi:uncharacterized protein YkwD
MVIKNIFSSALVIVFLCCFNYAVMAQSQEVCSGKAGAKGEFKIVNDLDFDIEVKSVLRDCTERKGLTVGAGRSIEISAYANQVFRVYENFTNRVITNVRFNSAQTDYPISGFQKSATDPGKKLCSREGDPRVFYIRNATGKPINVRFVTPECVEQKGPAIEPGKQIGGRTFINNVFRTYDQKTGTFISQIVIRPGKRNYVIGGERDQISNRSFLKTVNTIRSYSNLAPLELDPKLNATCQWFAEFMAKEDKRHAGHLVTDFTKKKAFKKMNKPTQRLRHFGWNRRKASNNVETTAMVRVEDPELTGAYFAMEWTASTTHFKPFYDLYRTKFQKVGFAAVASPSDPKLFYGCAIFANP